MTANIEKRVCRIAKEHADRVANRGLADADWELYRALAEAEARYDDLAKRLCAMVESTSPRGWWLKFRNGLLHAHVE